MTVIQINELALITDIQRTDSTVGSSNIRKYSRVQLLIEILIRLERILDEADKGPIGKDLRPYLKARSEKYIYRIKLIELPRELEKLCKVYHIVHDEISKKDKYHGTKEFINFELAFRKHFIVVRQETKAKPNNELNSGILQSPDDREATYRKKRDQEGKGFTINATETANPNNPIQLVPVAI